MDQLHNGNQRRPTDAVDYNGGRLVPLVSVMQLIRHKDPFSLFCAHRDWTQIPCGIPNNVYSTRICFQYTEKNPVCTYPERNRTMEALHGSVDIPLGPLKQISAGLASYVYRGLPTLPRQMSGGKTASGTFTRCRSTA